MANNYKAFKGILQYKSTDTFTKQAGYIYFVREFKDGKATDNAEVWFGTRKYGDVNATGLAELQSQITANAGDITSIKNILGQWSEQFKDNLSTVASAVVAVSADTKSIKDSYVSKFGGKTGEITVKGNGATNGDVNLTMNNNQLEASIVGLGSAAFKNIDYFDNQIEEVNNVLTAHTGNTDIHITSAERAAWNKAKEDIDVFLSGNTVDALDTLKEIQDYISKDGEVANILVSAIASAQTAADTAQSGVDNLVSLVGTGFTNTKTVVSEIARVERIADAAQTADEVDDAITNRFADLKFTGSTGGMVVVKLEQNNGKITTFNLNESGLTNALSGLKSDITSYTGTTNNTLTKLRTDVNTVSGTATNNATAITQLNTNKLDKTTYTAYTASTKTTLDSIESRLTAITDNAVTSVASSGNTIAITNTEGAVNVEVNTLAVETAKANGYIAIENNGGALYGVMYYGGDDAE